MRVPLFCLFLPILLPYTGAMVLAAQGENMPGNGQSTVVYLDLSKGWDVDPLGKMHEVGAYHRDFRPANLLACWDGEEWGVLVVDLEDVSLNHFPSRRERRRSFVRLFDQSDMMGGADRERFLEAYKRQCRIDIGEYCARVGVVPKQIGGGRE